MITAAIASIIGIVGGAVPDVLKEMRDTRNHARELEMLRLQANLQIEVAKQAGDSRLREIEAASITEQFQAMAENLKEIIKAQAQPTGLKWLDAANAMLRPVCSFLIMAIFMAVAIKFSWTVLQQMDPSNAVMTANVIFGSMVGEAFQAVFGFIFGYRSLVKK